MREGGSRDRWVTSPRVSTPGRPRSTREVYRPAVQDLSEQAARNGTGNQEETILSVVSSCTPRQSTSTANTSYSDTFHGPAPLMSQLSPEDSLKQMCFNHHNNEFHEDLHRQRVLVSAHQRRKLHSRVRRSRSTPAGASRSSSTSSVHDCHRNSWQDSDDDTDKLALVVTNGFRLDEKDFKERVNYRLTNRTKPKSAHANLMPNGAPLPVLNGYTQTLVQSFPQYSKKYCNWLTNGLKVQSFRTGHRSHDFSHARPPPPLLQYINRPKTVNGRWAAKNTRPKVDMNIVGVHKEVSYSRPEVQDYNQNGN